MSGPQRTGIVIFLFGVLFLAGCEETEPVYNTRFLAFGTLNNISLVGVSNQRAQAVVDELEKDFAIMHKAWHAWDPGPLTRTNRLIAERTRFVAPPSVLQLLQKAAVEAERSEHLFNPAIGHLIKLWGFQSDNPDCRQPPSKEAIDVLLAENPRLTDLIVDGIHIQSENSAVKLDFGAIGKGYGIDRSIEHLKEMGIEDAIVNSGGDLRAIGTRSGHPWRIAIRNPSGSGVLGFLYIAGDESVFTSGDYERNYLWEGQLYHHIIDPRTGYPAKGTSSVTVIHDNATTADAAATALFVAGPRDWYRIARKMGIKYVLLVDSEGMLHMNPAMEKRVELLHKRDNILISQPLTEQHNTNR